MRCNVNMIMFYFEMSNESEQNVMWTMIDAKAASLYESKRNVKVSLKFLLSQLTSISFASPLDGWLIH